MAEIDRLKVASDDDPVEQDPDLSDPDAVGPEARDEDAVHQDAASSELDAEDAADTAAKSDDPRELRFQLRRARRKLREADLQGLRLRKMAAQEAIERTRLALAHKESSDRADRLEREHNELKREHKDVSRDLERWREAAQQAKLQVDSLRERRRKEREDEQQFGLGTVIQEMLPVFDHLELAITHAESDPGHILAGVQMVMDQLDQTLERLMIERVEAEPGQPFLPECHEAVLHVPDTPHPPGSIVGLLRPGYTLKGRLLRAARVSVASRGDEPTHEASESDESVADEPTPMLKPIPLPLEDTQEVVFDPVPDAGPEDQDPKE